MTTVDLEAAFARRARQSVAAAGYAARVVVGDGRAGWVQGAPYDRVIVTASAGEVYRPWLDQLVEGGLIEMPLRLARGLSYQVVATFERHGELLSSTTAMTGFFMPLRGAAPDKSEERTYKWDGTESASPGLSASTSGPESRVLASVEALPGPALANGLATSARHFAGAGSDRRAPHCQGWRSRRVPPTSGTRPALLLRR